MERPNNKSLYKKIVYVFKSEIGKALIIGGGALLILWFLLMHFSNITEFLLKIINVLRPLFIGALMAFVLNRPLAKINVFFQKRFEKSYYKRIMIYRRERSIGIESEIPRRKQNLSFRVAIAVLYIIVLVIVGAIIGIIIPQLSESITMFFNNFDLYYINLEKFIRENLRFLNIEWLEKLDIMNKVYDISKYLPSLIYKTLDITTNIVKIATDIILGVVFSIYILCDKKKLKSQSARILKAVFKESTNEKIKTFLHLVADTFTEFICGQLTEALIVGILCFIGMTIFGFEYVFLISTIIGITNMIPIIGPILGTIPCAFILLLVNPYHALWFTVYIIILQQVESNFIYPKVVGESVGLPAIWVLTAVIVGGGLMGVQGMIIGIPVLSIIYSIIRLKVMQREEKQKEKDSI